MKEGRLKRGGFDSIEVNGKRLSSKEIDEINNKTDNRIEDSKVSYRGSLDVSGKEKIHFSYITFAHYIALQIALYGQSKT